LKIITKIPEPFNKRLDLDVRVDSEGMFSTQFDVDTVALFENSKIQLPRNRLNRPGKIESDTFAGLKDEVERHITILCSEREISRQQVIRFQINTACSYAFSAGGNFCTTATDRDKGGSDWKNGTVERNSNKVGPAGIWVWAFPYEKITYRFEATGKERIEYKSLYKHGFPSGDTLWEDPVQWLANMCSCGPDVSMKVQEVPLDEKTVIFFRDLFCSLFAMNERIKPFLNPDGVLAMANGDVKLLR